MVLCRTTWQQQLQLWQIAWGLPAVGWAAQGHPPKATPCWASMLPCWAWPGAPVVVQVHTLPAPPRSAPPLICVSPHWILAGTAGAATFIAENQAVFSSRCIRSGCIQFRQHCYPLHLDGVQVDAKPSDWDSRMAIPDSTIWLSAVHLWEAAVFVCAPTMMYAMANLAPQFGRFASTCTPSIPSSPWW